MAVKLRLKRMGKKGAPFYRIVAADSRSPRDGRFIETIGTYDPMTDPAQIKVDAELAMKWLKNGAQPSQGRDHEASALRKKRKVAYGLRKGIA